MNNDPAKSRLLRQDSQDSRMNVQSSDDLVDMLIMREAADCKGLFVLRLYQERYKYTRAPLHTTFASVNRRLRETVFLTRSTVNQERTTRTLDNE